MKNTTPPFIVNDDILTAGPTRQLLMRWKNGKKNALLAPPLLSSAHPPWQEASTPVMRESDFATEQFKYAMYVIKCILSSLSSITSSSPCRRSLHKKNFSVSKFRMSLASMFYSRLDMFISLWTFHLFEEFLNFWREKKKRGNIIIMK